MANQLCKTWSRDLLKLVLLRSEHDLDPARKRRCIGRFALVTRCFQNGSVLKACFLETPPHCVFVLRFILLLYRPALLREFIIQCSLFLYLTFKGRVRWVAVAVFLNRCNFFAERVAMLP